MLHHRAATNLLWATPDVRAPRNSWSLVFRGGSNPCFKPFLVVSRYTFVALRESHQFFSAYDVVDALERLVASTAIDFVQNGVGGAFRFASTTSLVAGRRLTW